MKSLFKKAQKGFTLIELLIVIAILGILAAAVLVALDPIEQINRGKDSGRISTVEQLGRAVQAYYTSQAGYPAVGTTWQTTLVNSGEIRFAATVPVSTATACTTNAHNAVCYVNNTTDAIVWTVLDSKSSKTKASCTATQVAVAAWIASQGKAGVTCITTGATPAYTATLY